MSFEGYGNNATKQFTAQIRVRGGIESETMSAGATLDKSSSNILRLNGGTSDRTIVLPAEETSEGLFFLIQNTGTSNALSIVDDAAGAVSSLAPGEVVLVTCEGASWVETLRGNDARSVVTASFEYGEATPLDQFWYIAHRPMRVIGITVRPLVVGSDAGAVTAVIKKAPSGTAMASGTALHSGSADLKGTINTNQALTLSTTSSDLDIAAGDAIGWDTTGTMTAARGAVSVALIPA